MKRSNLIFYYILPALLFTATTVITRLTLASSKVVYFSNFFWSLILISVPVVLLYLVLLAFIKLIIELRKGKFGSKFQARILFYFSIIIICTILPMFLALNANFNRSMDFWFVESIQKALESAYAWSQDYYNYEKNLLKTAVDRHLALHREDPLSRQSFDRLNQSSSIVFSKLYVRRTLRYAFTRSGVDLDLMTDTEFGEYKVQDELFLRKKFKGRYFLLHLVRIQDEKAILVTAREMRPESYRRSLAIEQGFSFYNQANLIRRSSKQVLGLLMVDFVLFILLITAVLSIILAKQISRPVFHLYEGIQNIATGRLDYYIDYNRQDEMKALIHAFNNMTKELAFNQQAVLHSQHIQAWKKLAIRRIEEIKKRNDALIEALKDEKQSDGERLALAMEVQKTAEELSSYSETPKLVLKKENINDIIREVMEIFEKLSTNISFYIELDNSLPLLNVNRQQIHQVLVNLVKNAIEAIPGRGKGQVRIRTIVSKQFSGTTVKVEVLDSGNGINDDILPRIYDPYFTTKKSKQGLGLTIVKRILQEHEARISYRRIDGNSVFTLEFSAS